MFTIGIVEYINALPFYLPFHLAQLQTNASFTLAVPAELNRQLQEKRLDIALTSCSEYLDGPYQRNPKYCISAYKEILSVNLYLRTSLEGARIGLTSQSRTSVELLKILSHYFWKVEPNFVYLNREESLSAYDGFLLIGDEALKQMIIPGYTTIDLAKQWYEATQLPFVFAVFSIREGIKYNSDEIEAALQWSETHRECLVEEAERLTGLCKTLINKYYDKCRYRLEKKEREGLDLFERLRKYVS